MSRDSLLLYNMTADVGFPRHYILWLTINYAISRCQRDMLAFLLLTIPSGIVPFLGQTKDLARPDICFDTSLANACTAGIRCSDANR